MRRAAVLVVLACVSVMPRVAPAQTVFDYFAAPAEGQLAQAARELHEMAKDDYSLRSVEVALKESALRAEPLGITRIKWLKVLALWQLYPKGLPEHNQIAEILRDTSQPQDVRMRAVVALAEAKVKKP